MLEIIRYGECNTRRAIYTFLLDGTLRFFEFQQYIPVTASWYNIKTWDRTKDPLDAAPVVPDNVIAEYDRTMPL